MLKLPSLQPSTVVGIASAIGTVAGAVAHVLTKDMSIATASGVCVASVVAVIVPDNTALARDTATLAKDAVTAVVQRKLAERLPELFADGTAVAADLSRGMSAPAPSAPVPAPAPASPSALASTT